MPNSREEEYLELYAQLETILRRDNKIPEDKGAIAWAKDHLPKYRGVKLQLDYCSKVRNFMIHEGKLDSAYTVTPSDVMIDFIRRTIEDIEKLPRAFDIDVKRAEVHAETIDGKIRPAMRRMVECSYTHIPILEDERVVGVFSENTLLSYMMRDTIVEIDDNATFGLMADLLPLKAHESETFGFVAQTDFAYDIAERFKASLKDQERLGMLFVTAHGKPNERLLGIITAWDLARFL